VYVEIAIIIRQAYLKQISGVSIMSIFDKRVNLKPYEYEEIDKYTDAINHSYWLVSYYNIDSDVQDFKVQLFDKERSAIKNSLLAISQIEVKIKEFWAKVGDRFPKPEIQSVGYTCAESEVRHMKAYSHLLERLQLNADFNLLLTQPAIQGRVNYLTKYLAGANDKNNQDYMLTLALFSLFVENISLFSQFAIIKSFYKQKNMFKGIDTIINATMKEELIHALLGIYIINQVKKEFPHWFNNSFYDQLYESSEKAFVAECGIIDWIFENGELDFLSKESLKEFIKQRFNESISMIGGKPVFNVNKSQLVQLRWFEEDILAKGKTDFFNQHVVDYSIGSKSFSGKDLF
jgi:ribonucleoside-diphosphate reductase beta chain